METITLSGITIGNAKYDAAFEIDETAKAALVEQGLLRVLQGKPSGDAEAEMLGILFPGKKRAEIEVVDSETGKTRQFRRTDIPYSPEYVAALKKFYGSATIKVGEDDKGKAVTVPLNMTKFDASEYESGKVAVPKYKAEKDTVRAYLFEADGKTPRLLKSGEPRTAETFASNRGLATPTEPWEEDTEWLQSVKDWIRAQGSKED